MLVKPHGWIRFELSGKILIETRRTTPPASNQDNLSVFGVIFLIFDKGASMRKLLSLLVIFLSCMATVGNAQTSFVTGGETSVSLDTDTLASAASLAFSSVSNDVTVSPASAVLFGINARDAASLPTTFSYASGSFSTFAGTIEHTGSVFFNNDTVEVGDFTIGFDVARASGLRSGFFVESTAGIPAILFDVGVPSSLTAGTTNLDIDADLLVSNEFATFLTANNLAASDLTGADVGDASIRGVSAVPEPSSLVLLSMLGMFGARRRRS